MVSHFNFISDFAFALARFISRHLQLVRVGANHSPLVCCLRFVAETSVVVVTHVMQVSQSLQHFEGKYESEQW
jgi:hypothetical protein